MFVATSFLAAALAFVTSGPASVVQHQISSNAGIVDRGVVRTNACGVSCEACMVELEIAPAELAEAVDVTNVSCGACIIELELAPAELAEAVDVTNAETALGLSVRANSSWREKHVDT